MNDRLLNVYHRLPGISRSAAASLWGLRLRSWRYGPDTDRLVADAIERETWSPAKWRSYQEERLNRLLRRAAADVRYYADHWAARRQAGDRTPWERLENWPILEKQVVREGARHFVATDCDIRHMHRDQTSGTSGTPVSIYCSRQTLRAWYALAEARWRLWYGLSRRDRWAILGGQMVAPAARREPPFWVWNQPLKQLYMSSYHLASDLIPAYLDALKRFEITYVLGYSSSLYALARAMLETGRQDIRLRVAITNAEPLFAYQRTAIATAFNCPVRETYGMSEMAAAASECEHGVMHLWPDAGVVETVEGVEPAPAGEIGELVSTGLLNTDMPFIRYRIGDRGVLGTSQSCLCGRTLPRLKSVEGRTDDVLYTRDGRAIGRLDPVFKADLPVIEAQIVQETLDRIRVRYVPSAEFGPSAGRELADRIRERLGDVDIVLEPLAQVPRTSRGKFRAVVSALPESERLRVAKAGEPCVH